MMVQALVEMGRRVTLLTTLGSVFVLGSLAQQDPPSRVARLNYVDGNVSMEPAGVDDWAPAEVNHPFTIGDYLYTDAGARAELHLDVAAIRMGSQTSFGFLNLNDQTVQIKLSEGDMYFSLHHFGVNQVFEVDTPNAAVQLLRDGVYRFRVDPNGAMSFVVVREGQAEVTGGGQAFTINPNNSALISGTDQPGFDVEQAPASDDFDHWCAERDIREARAASRRYLPPTVIGYEDLDGYGAWQEEAEYGPVWYPQQVPVDWAPYHHGHWAWIQPWGWTWVDAAPWGFAPFHYGRWAYIGHRWGWCPGPIAVVGYHGPVIRPYYAPALVAWFGGAHWGIGISSGPSLGWVPLGFGEVFTPAYACSRPYFHNVNTYNTRIVNNVNITNVYNTVYVNKTVYNRQFINMHAPNAIYAMPQSAFASGQPVRRAGFVVKQADLRQGAPAAVVSPGVAPTREAFIRGGDRPVVRPQPQVVNRQVVAVHAPPAVAPAPFAARVGGSPQIQPNTLASVAAPHGGTPAVQVIRPAAVARPVQAQPGQHFGRSEMVRPQGSVPPPSAAQQQSVSPARPNVQTPSMQQPSHLAQQPQPAHGVPPNMRGPASPQESRNERVQQQPPAQHNPNRPFAQPTQPPPATGNVPTNKQIPSPSPFPHEEARPAGHLPSPPPQPSHERPIEHVAPPPQPPQHPAVEHPEYHQAPEAPRNQTPPQHAQPSSPPPAHQEQHNDHPAAHDNGGSHNRPKSQ